MSFPAVLLIWTVLILLTGLIARRNGRGVVGWMFFALFAAPLAFLAVLLAGRPRAKRAARLLSEVETTSSTSERVSSPRTPLEPPDQGPTEIDDEAFQRWFENSPFASSELSPDAILALRDIYAREARSGALASG